jgi:peptide/nickel transport system permease protein
VRRFILTRAVHAAIVVIAVVTLAFVLVRATPGNPFWALDDPNMTPADVARLQSEWGYDQPIPVQYAKWVRNVARGDFGWSHSNNRYVRAVLRTAVPNTLLLMVPAIVIGVLAGIAAGTWQATRRLRGKGGVADGISLAIISVPDFVIALAVVSVVAYRWRLVPGSGMTSPDFASLPLLARVADVGAHLILPCITLAVVIAASVARYQRASMIGVLHEEFLRTARAKGAPERRVVRTHALRNSLGPVIAVAGLLFPMIFGGAVFIESVFGWPGMGLTLVAAVTGRDYALVQAIVLIGTVFVVVAGTLADIAAVMVNPRTTLQE